MSLLLSVSGNIEPQSRIRAERRENQSRKKGKAGIMEMARKVEET
jgi:hypothetical protein